MPFPHHLRRESSLKGFVESIPLFTPREMFDRLTAAGYKGQEDARRAVCLTAYRHVRRVKLVHSGGVERSRLPPKANLLVMGPTGCGKTYLVELLFRDILKLPTAIIDITGFTETGYVGRNAITILTSLLKAAGDDPERASVGIVCLDEFDKLAASTSLVRFDGEGTTKDISGYGVQKELLKLLSASSVDVPLEFHNPLSTSHAKMPTDDVTFLVCGAFSGFKSVAAWGAPRMGFRGKPPDATHEPGSKLQEEEIENVSHFQSYGFLPELVARFSRVVALEPLGAGVLRAILADSVLPGFVNEFRHEGLQLAVAEEVLEAIVREALERRVGARGLGMELTKLVERAAFEHFGRGPGTVRLELRGGKPAATLDRSREDPLPDTRGSQGFRPPSSECADDPGAEDSSGTEVEPDPNF